MYMEVKETILHKSSFGPCHHHHIAQTLQVCVGLIKWGNCGMSLYKQQLCQKKLFDLISSALPMYEPNDASFQHTT